MLRPLKTEPQNPLIERANEAHIKGKDSKLIPILDRDPILAANFLTVKDAEDALLLLIDTFRYLKSPLQQNKALELNILLNRETFSWYAKFATELDRLVTGISAIEIPYYQLEDIKEKSDFPLTFFPPIKYNLNYKRIEPLKFKVRDKNPINLWRITYIREEYEETEFFDGYPAWYMMSEITVHESYSTRTNRRIRIDFINGEFVYYIAGASDNWRRIVGVPSEMDYVVASLLFKN